MAKRYFDNSSKIKPGVISEELREAAGIHRDKLPIWIYRMRVLGYPPGYLKQAQVSTLSIFDDSAPTAGAKEDGEIPEPSTSAAANGSGVQYNKDSFVEYPGFNTPVPTGIRDDWYYLRMPPMLEQQQLKEALKTMHVTEPVPYKRRRAVEPTSTTTSSSPFKSPDSKLDDRSTRDTNNGFANGKQTSGESEDNGLNAAKCEPIVSKEAEDVVTISDESADEVSDVNDMNGSKSSLNSLNESTDSARRLKMIAMGSPMPASERPVRPSLEKWSEGMGELLYFENIPNYTGNYKNKMKGIIDKIRLKNSQT